MAYLKNIGEVTKELVAMPRQQVPEIVLFVAYYDILAGGVGQPAEKNCVSVSVTYGKVSARRVFEDISDYWAYVCDILADSSKNTAKKANAMFCFQCAFSTFYLMPQKGNPEEYAKCLRIYSTLGTLVEDLVNKAARDRYAIIVPPEARMSEHIRLWNCQVLTDKIFSDMSLVRRIQYEILPKVNDFTLQVCGLTFLSS
ncbi:MAG: hypothetical protein QXM31_04310 [Candidatus Woesearchaeota archaeon]